MAKKKNKNTNTNTQNTSSSYRYHSPVKVWAVRIIVALLCISVVVTLIPSIFF